ncbi:hypothetical protein PLANTIT3_100062 [Plantibacter sp. T3]|nr:hypothetical protein PLANTIT3_100062 [Plantibacter sp. T3]
MGRHPRDRRRTLGPYWDRRGTSPGSGHADRGVPAPPARARTGSLRARPCPDSRRL